MKLSVKGLGLSLGILWGVCLFLSTLIAVQTGYMAEALSELMGVYPWYQVTWTGAFIGLVEGFIDGFIGGALIAWLYNIFSR